MSARITIQSGIAAGKSHFVDGRVARVGSDPHSEVCIPTADIPAHALTLEFRDNHCRVYNRCNDSVYVGARAVVPDEVVEWPETDILQLGADIELLLDFDADEQAPDQFDDPNGVESATEQTQDGDEVITHAESNKTGSMKTALQLGVTVACLVGCALLLLREQGRTSAPQPGPGFNEVISHSISSGDVAPALIRRIQYAEAQRIRGRTELADNQYQSIRDDLLLASERVELDAENPNAPILKFIQTRLTK